MPAYDIAHIHKQGQDIIIVFVSSAFGSLSLADQNEQQLMIQSCAVSANLAGVVVPVWKTINSHGFLAPQAWHPFFRDTPWEVLCSYINKKLTCSS